jgi:two-component sensor histidine kinase
MTLGARLIILILLAAVPVFVIQITSDYELREGRKASALQTAETLAGLVAARQDRVVEGARLLLEATSHLQSIQEKNAALCNLRLRQIAEKVQELTAMAVLTPQGDRWCLSLSDTGQINLADRKYFQDTLKTRSMQSSDYIVGRQTGEGSLVFTYPAVGDGGSIESVVFVAYRTSVLSRMLNEPPLPEGAIVAVVDRFGVVAARWPDPEKWVGERLADSPILRQAMDQRRGSARGFADWAGSEEYAFAFAPMQPPTHLTVVVALPLTAALKEADSLFWREAGWTTLVFLLAALLAILGVHLAVVRPLRELSGSVDRLARGDFDGHSTAELRGSSELKSLRQHFVAMARALQERQTQLLEALQQKEVLLKEVNHRVKNSLQLVASLFGLQRAHVRDPEARRQFDEAGRRINTVAQIHQRLYQDADLDRVALDSFLKEMCADLGSAWGNDRISITCDAEACHLPTQDVIPVALIVNELITNAFKYSYPDEGRSGVIRVTCQLQDKHVVLMVSDDGAALREDFDPRKSDGLGMKMITALAKQLRTTLEVVRQSSGKTFVVRVPRGDSR